MPSSVLDIFSPVSASCDIPDISTAVSQVSQVWADIQFDGNTVDIIRQNTSETILRLWVNSVRNTRLGFSRRHEAIISEILLLHRPIHLFICFRDNYRLFSQREATPHQKTDQNQVGQTYPHTNQLFLNGFGHSLERRLQRHKQRPESGKPYDLVCSWWYSVVYGFDLDHIPPKKTQKRYYQLSNSIKNKLKIVDNLI